MFAFLQVWQNEVVTYWALKCVFSFSLKHLSIFLPSMQNQWYLVLFFWSLNPFQKKSVSIQLGKIKMRWYQQLWSPFFWPLQTLKGVLFVLVTSVTLLTSLALRAPRWLVRMSVRDNPLLNTQHWSATLNQLKLMMSKGLYIVLSERTPPANTPCWESLSLVAPGR